MQQQSPSFGQVVLGTLLGNCGCFLISLLLSVCLIGVLARSGPSIANIFSRVTNGLYP